MREMRERKREVLEEQRWEMEERYGNDKDEERDERGKERVWVRARWREVIGVA